MILNPRLSPADQSPASGIPRSFIPAWDAVFRTQKASAASWLLVAQPDHAALAGELAQRIQSSDFPTLDDEVLRAISLHDEGWQSFDDQPMIHDRRPLSFLDLGPSEFLEAWTKSTSTAEGVGPLAGILVSGHFLRLAHVHIETRGENPLVRKFVQDESARQNRLRSHQKHSLEELSVLVDVLQFCDLLSLYLCCGTREAVEFPQRFNNHSVRLYREGEMCYLQPSIFDGGASLGVSARTFPHQDGEVTIPVLLG
jgi:hypothetical protein